MSALIAYPTCKMIVALYALRKAKPDQLPGMYETTERLFRSQTPVRINFGNTQPTAEESQPAATPPVEQATGPVDPSQ